MLGFIEKKQKQVNIELTLLAKELVFATNLNFLIHISMEPDVVDF